MTEKEVKEAFLTAAPVMYKGREYRPITALIYRRSGKGMFVQAEIHDNVAANTVYIVAPNDLQPTAEAAEKGTGKQP